MKRAGVQDSRGVRLCQRLVLWLGVMGLAWPTAGCGPKPTIEMPLQGQQVQGHDEVVKRIKADAVKFMEDTLAETRNLQQVTIHFQRQERLGLFAELRPVENIFAEYRDEPFSVRFTWLDEDSEYRQCVYVEGEHGNNVVLLPRRGIFGLPTSEQQLAPSLAVVFGKARNPITDFGPRRLMERTLDRIKKARLQGEVTTRLLPSAEIGPAKEPCFHLEIRYPQGDRYPCKLQDLYIHEQTHLPVGTYLWLPGTPERTEETLDAMYVYSNLNSDVTLGDGHFVINVDKRGPDKSKGKPGTDVDGPGHGPQATALSHQQGNQ
ncbi:MAG: DUF1571 domain-containing protein [Phycisphaerae bacterium]|nr:DUF1571 domain-containing protein [Phycisphaerae bacterium]